MAKKQQATSHLLTCDICGKKVYARGLKSHVRLQHKLNLTTQVVTQVVTKEYIAPDLVSSKKSSKKTTAPEGILFKEEVDVKQDENSMLMGYVGLPPKSAWERKVEAANLKASNHKFLQYVKEHHPDKYKYYYELLKS